MANRFLNNIKINDSYTLPAADGTADQVITTDGSGQLSFVDQSTLAVDSAEVVEIPVKNLQGSGLTKGDPVYISGSVGASGRLEVQLADAGNTAKMPAVGLLKQDLAINGEGYVVVTGKLRNLVTSPIDGVTPSEGDVVYVKSGGSTGAALTTTKPTGSSNLIQNMGKVGRVSTASDGTFVVSSILRSNDVPNLTTGKIWVGDGNTTESTVVHLDEANNEMGINTNNPAAVLHVTRSTGSVPLFQVDDVGDKYFQVLPDSNTTFLIGDLDAVGGNGYIKGTFNSIQFHSESGELVRIKDNGNVGIGTDSPVARAHIYGPNHTGAFNAGALIIQQSSDDTRMFIDGNDIDAADGILFLNDYSQNPVRLGDDLQMPNGSIGVGFTSAPAAKVHASDGGTVPSIDAGTMFLASNTSATGDYSSMSIMSGTAGIASLFFGDTDAEKRGSVRYLNSADEMRFRTANTDRVTIKSGGNVGIGTTDPGQKLDVDGYIAAHRFTDSDNASFYLEPGSGATGQWKVQTPSGYVSIGPNNTSWAHFYTDRSNGYYFDKRIVADTGIFGSYNEDLTLQAPYNTTRMTINSSTGNVGINTTNPGYHLDVDGEARIGSTNRESTRLLIQAENTAGAPAAATEIRMLGYESRAQGIFFQDSANSGEEWFAGLNYAAGWDKYSIGYDASGGQGEYVDNAILTVKGTVARVGVKNHDPQADMDVNGTIRAVGGTFTSGTSGADSNASAGIVLRRGKKLFSGIPQNSNQDFYLRSLLEQTTSGEIIIGQGGTGLITDISLKPGTSGNIKFFGSGSEDMRIDSVGDLQIGTSYNPAGYKVNINGDIGASTGSQLYMYQDGGTGSTNAVIRVVNLDTSNYGQSTPNIYSDSGNYYGNRHCEFATNGTVRGWIGHNGSTTVTYSTTSSDERLKKNIEAWDEDTLNKFRNIQPKKFNFIDQEDTDSKERGYIAQNMVDSFPEAYPHDFSISQTEGMYSFNPSGMVVYLMKAVKDLIAENDNLKARVEALENA